MNTGFAIGAAGLAVARQRMDQAADQIARGGMALPAVASADAGARLPAAAATTASTGTAAAAVPATVRIDEAGAKPDLANAMVEQLAASAAFLANLRTIERTDETMSALLDAVERGSGKPR